LPSADGLTFSRQLLWLLLIELLHAVGQRSVVQRSGGRLAI
jgi:hypothetical protein